MKRLVFHLLVRGLTLLSLCSCQEVPRRVRFDEEAFTPYAGSGSGVITGRAAGVFEKNTPKVADHQAVKLMPDNAYTEEIERVTFRHTDALSPADPRFAKYVREVKTDGNGNFAFSHVPPGRYYVTCRFT